MVKNLEFQLKLENHLGQIGLWKDNSKPSSMLDKALINGKCDFDLALKRCIDAKKPWLLKLNHKPQLIFFLFLIKQETHLFMPNKLPEICIELSLITLQLQRTSNTLPETKFITNVKTVQHAMALVISLARMNNKF